ncbi:hypothetical protein, partial [Cysteiniphilum marinum]
VHTDSKLGTNGVHTDSKLGTNEVHTDSKLGTNEVHTDSKLGTNEVHTDSKLGTEKFKISSFSPLVSNIIEYLYKQVDDYQKRETAEVKIYDIANSCHTSTNTAKVTIKRLTAKLIITRIDYKAGKFGWSRYKIANDIFKQLMDKFSKNAKDDLNKDNPSIYNSNTTNTINKYSNDTEEQKPTTPQNDQLIDLIKKQNDQFQQQIAELQKQFLQQAPQIQPETKAVTVTESTKNNTLESDNEDWADLDFSSLTEFGFTKRHVTQIKNFNKTLEADNQLTVDSVQESIEHYAWALQNRLDEMVSYAPANNRLRGLIGVLKKGGNWTEANYKSPEDLAFEASLKAKEERLLKLKEQKERVFNIEFELWRESLTVTEITEIEEKGELQGKMPPSAFKNKGDNKMYVAALRTYFKQNIYKG